MIDSRYGSPRAVDAVDPTASYDTWPTLPSTQMVSRSRCSPCGRRLSWTAVSVLEIVVTVLIVVWCFFLPKRYLKQILPPDRRDTDSDKITELTEWVLRMFASMTCVQVCKA